jgi:uncharacterized repeat protein (TIGR02543 family)
MTIRRSLLISAVIALLGTMHTSTAGASAILEAPVAPSVAGDGITAYISPPFVQGPKESINATIETFDSLTHNATASSFSSTVGTFANIVAYSGEVEEWGGANTTTSTPTAGGTASKYASPAGGSPATLTFVTPVRYMGFWWSAGSPTNTVKVYSSASDSTPVAEFTSLQLDTLLGSTPNPYPGSAPLTAIDGTTYTKGHYFGRPRDHTQVAPTAWHNRFLVTDVNRNIYSHAYINIFASGSVGFGKVEFSSGGFEFDNVAISTTVQTPTPELVFVQSVLGKSVSFDANGGSGAMAAQTSTTATSLTTNAFTRPGFTFSGWHTTRSGTGGADYTDQANYGFTADTTLYAQWTANTLAITYDTAGGSTTPAGSTTTGGTLTDPGTPTRDGHTFTGWHTTASGGTPITFPHPHGQTTDFTLHAQWTANTLAITYDTAGGSTIPAGTTTTGGTITDPGTPTRDGHTFTGWHTTASGGTPITFPHAHGQTTDFTLYARWTPVESQDTTTSTSSTPDTTTPDTTTPDTTTTTTTSTMTPDVTTSEPPVISDATRLPATGIDPALVIALGSVVSGLGFLIARRRPTHRQR